jgi:hypothetical protein
MRPHVIYKVQAFRGLKGEAIQKTVKISLIRSTSKLSLETHFDHPKEGPDACAGLSSINLNLSVHLSIVPI